MRRIQRRHFGRGFDDIGYHFVIMPSGRIFLGRPQWAVGAHVKGHNADTVGVGLAGDFNVQAPTRQAIDAIGYVRRSLIPAGVAVSLLGHSDLAAKDCPGTYLVPYLDGDRDLELDERTSSPSSSSPRISMPSSRAFDSLEPGSSPATT
jgi:hypothetical protein